MFLQEGVGQFHRRGLSEIHLWDRWFNGPIQDSDDKHWLSPIEAHSLNLHFLFDIEPPYSFSTEDTNDIIRIVSGAANLKSLNMSLQFFIYDNDKTVNFLSLSGLGPFGSGKPLQKLPIDALCEDLETPLLLSVVAEVKALAKLWGDVTMDAQMKVWENCCGDGQWNFTLRRA